MDEQSLKEQEKEAKKSTDPLAPSKKEAMDYFAQSRGRLDADQQHVQPSPMQREPNRKIQMKNPKRKVIITYAEDNPCNF